MLFGVKYSNSKFQVSSFKFTQSCHFEEREITYEKSH